MKRHIALLAASIIVAATAALALFERRDADLPVAPTGTTAPLLFDGASAMRFAQAQCDIGPRPTGTAQGKQTGDTIIATLKSFGWSVEEQKFDYRAVPIRNIIAKRGQGAPVILGAHYDTRPRADQDPRSPASPIIGANDGASGVAVLLELARVLPALPAKSIWLAFFDAEDWGGIDGWPFSVGADYLAASLTQAPQAVVVLDMIGDRDLQIYYEQNSNMAIQQAIFGEAARLGYSANFIAQPRFSMTDDHTPFLQRGYAAVDLIDFDYPYWHTLADTCDKISAMSMEKVGRTMTSWLARSKAAP
ncbi:MAG: M28 family peptidase [Chloroflexi bacterium]|nr:M28 family peptidase [Chloroflexota bacterium]